VGKQYNSNSKQHKNRFCDRENGLAAAVSSMEAGAAAAAAASSKAVDKVYTAIGITNQEGEAAKCHVSATNTSNTAVISATKCPFSALVIISSVTAASASVRHGGCRRRPPLRESARRHCGIAHKQPRQAASAGVPHKRAAVRTRACQPCAITAKRDRGDGVLVLTQCSHTGAAPHIPQPQRAPPTARNKAAAVRGECQQRDGIAMLQHTQAGAAAHVPEPGTAVVRPRGKQCFILAEGDSMQAVLVPLCTAARVVAAGQDGMALYCGRAV
jgi:hypothetical protein